MDAHSLYGPLLAMMLVTLAVWVYMYVRRIAFLTRQDVPPDLLTPARLAEISPPAVANPSDNLKNLFELPVLFYALVLCLELTGSSDVAYLLAAWWFVGFRVLHSIVHCTVNVVLLRFWLYAIGSLALWFMLLRATYTLVHSGGNFP
jgi:hypothetical protein